MKIGNVAGKLDLSKPFTQADIRRALGEIKAMYWSCQTQGREVTK